MTFTSLFYKLFFCVFMGIFTQCIVAQEKNIPVASNKKHQTYTSSSTWQQAMVNHIYSSHKYYPSEARRYRIQGKVIVKGTIDAQGNLIDTKILKTSGSQLLDNAAIEMTKKISPYPRPPKQLLKKGTVSFIVPIVYSLKSFNKPNSFNKRASLFFKNLENTDGVQKQFLIFLYIIYVSIVKS